MTVLTVLEKCYGPRWRSLLRVFAAALTPLIGGLDVQFTVLGRTGTHWIQVEVTGSDDAVATRYLDQTFGLAPLALANVHRFMELRGKILDAGRVGYGLYVDVGITSPRPIDVFLPLHVLRSQLADGHKLSVPALIDAFALHDNRPLTIQVTRIDAAKGDVEGRLSPRQSAVFAEWVSLDFDRILVLGAPFPEVQRLVTRSPLARDVIKVLSLGFLEQLLLCKLGTEGPGLIQAIGSRLPQMPLHCFSPQRARLIGENP